jgi:hypothetical protein
MNSEAILEARRTIMLTKPRRAESRIWHLCDEHFVEFCKWVLAGLGEKKIREHCEVDLKLPPEKIPGRNAISDFWSEFGLCLLEVCRAQAALLAKGIATSAAKSPAEFSAATLAALEQRVFEMSLSPNTDPRDIKALCDILEGREDRKLKVRQIEMQERRLTLLEKKEADAKSTLTDSKLTSEEKVQKMREVFGAG